MLNLKRKGWRGYKDYIGTKILYPEFTREMRSMVLNSPKGTHSIVHPTFSYSSQFRKWSINWPIDKHSVWSSKRHGNLLGSKNKEKHSRTSLKSWLNPLLKKRWPRWIVWDYFGFLPLWWIPFWSDCIIKDFISERMSGWRYVFDKTKEKVLMKQV